MQEEYLEELKSVREAIKKLTADPTSSQSVSSGNGGSYSATMLDITKLYARERELIHLIADIAQGGGLGLTYPVFCGG